MARDSYKWVSYKKDFGSWWVVVDVGGYILPGGGWWWIYFGWWWVVVDGDGGSFSFSTAATFSEYLLFYNILFQKSYYFTATVSFHSYTTYLFVSN